MDSEFGGLFKFNPYISYINIDKNKNKIKEYANSLFNTIDALTFRTSI